MYVKLEEWTGERTDERTFDWRGYGGIGKLESGYQIFFVINGIGLLPCLFPFMANLHTMGTKAGAWLMVLVLVLLLLLLRNGFP